MSMRSYRDQVAMEDEEFAKRAPTLRHRDVFRVNEDGPLFQLILAGNGPEARPVMTGNPRVIVRNHGFVRIGRYAYEFIRLSNGAFFREKGRVVDA